MPDTAVRFPFTIRVETFGKPDPERFAAGAVGLANQLGVYLDTNYGNIRVLVAPEDSAARLLENLQSTVAKNGNFCSARMDSGVRVPEPGYLPEAEKR